MYVSKSIMTYEKLILNDTKLIIHFLHYIIPPIILVYIIYFQNVYHIYYVICVFNIHITHAIYIIHDCNRL